jgi:predicted membrane chloride channel (bestrophin family)
VLGFVVGLALSFRSSTAYERYNEGRKYWSQLTFVSQNLARLIWIHVDERHDDPALGKQDLLAKISCLNMISAYAVALKHKLRFESATSIPTPKPPTCPNRAEDKTLSRPLDNFSACRWPNPTRANF